jgi:hypothetical protein
VDSGGSGAVTSANKSGSKNEKLYVTIDMVKDLALASDGLFQFVIFRPITDGWELLDSAFGPSHSSESITSFNPTSQVQNLMAFSNLTLLLNYLFFVLLKVVAVIWDDIYWDLLLPVHGFENVFLVEFI